MTAVGNSPVGSTTPVEASSGRRSPLRAGDDRPGRSGWVFAAIWLFYLLEPARRAWSAPSLPWRVVGLAALAVFAVGFVTFFAWWRNRRVAGRPPTDHTVWLAVGTGLVLMALAAPAAGESVLAAVVYLGVVPAMTLPARQTLVVLAGLVAVVLVAPALVPGWVSQAGMIPELVLAVLAAFGVGQVIDRNAQLARAREALVDLAVTEERARLARDVHDILGHSLTVITVKAELAGRLLEQAGPSPAVERARAEVDDVEQLSRAALADVRATVAGTREVSLAGELAAARLALGAAGIAADVPTTVEEVPPAHRELFAWVVREGVTNVVRHSAARSCRVLLTADCVSVVDDGLGPSVNPAGTGLQGLRARADAAGARLETGSAPGGGFRLRVTTA